MKKIFCVLMVLSIIVLVGCKSQPTVSTTGPGVPSDVPEWYLNTPKAEGGIYGLGVAKFPNNQNMSRTMAENRARQSIAQELSSNVKNMIEDHTAGSEYANAGSQFAQTVSQTLAEAKLAGARIEQRYIAKDGTFYALAYYSKDNAFNDFNTAVESAKLQHAEFKNFQAQEAMKEAFYNEEMKGAPVTQ
jgi:hypothetical protein